MAALLILITLVILAVLFVAGLICFDMFSGSTERTLAERRNAQRRWQPPFARGKDLAHWARAKAGQIVGNWLEDKPTSAAAEKLSAELHDGATRAMLPLVPDHQAQRTVACPDEGQGMVGITVPEVLEIADYIRRMPRAERKRIHDLAFENAKKLKNLDHNQYNADQTPCPLQGDDQVCRVYDARPLRCRPLHAATIARQLGLEAPKEGEIPEWLPDAQTVEQGIEEGEAQALQSAGLDANLYELNSALVTALDTPDAAQRWRKGEDTFAECTRYR
jgi:Fe-S-cluster containining protein